VRRWIDDPNMTRWAWLGYALLGSITIGSYFMWDGGPVASTIYGAVGLSSVAAILLGVRLHRPHHRSPWYLVAAGAVLFVGGDTIYSYYIFVRNIEAPWPSYAEPVYLIGYGFLVAGLLKFVKFSKSTSRGALIDASIVATSLGMILWLYLMKPYAIDDALSISQRFWSMSSPFMDFAILAVMARLFLSPGRRSASYVFLWASFLLLPGADILYGIQSLSGSYVGGFTTDGAWLLSYVLLGASALHPSMVRLTRPATAVTRSGRSRLILIGVASVVFPVNVVIQNALGNEIDIWRLVISGSLLIGLVLTRMNGLLKGESQQVDLLEEKERVLRASLEERAALTDQLRHQAFHDPLTGLPNRKLFMDRVQHALTRRLGEGMVVCVIYLDLDDFKAVNDSAGHGYGDDLLKAIGERLRAAMRPEDTICRMGGDEFTILIESIRPSDLEVTAARIKHEFGRPFIVSDSHVTVGASLGLATGDGKSATAEDLIHNSDVAMYRIKLSDKGGIAFHKAGEVDDLARERVIRSDLPEALDSGEITLAYQPIFQIAPRTLVAVEALARWAHPQLGPIPPLGFISIAEKSDLVTDVDLHVLGTALRQAADWDVEFGIDPALKIAINVSSRSLAQADFVERAAGLIDHFGIPGERIILEITETSMMSTGESLLHQLAALKALGVQLALDDFGTGYSSLARLRDLPIDILKIDQSFTNLLPTPHAIELMTFVISMAQRSGMTTVAEGIESAEQLVALESLRCDLGQGYLLGRPGPPEAVEDLLVGRASDGARPHLLLSPAKMAVPRT